jgi:hypothetical protein
MEAGNEMNKTWKPSSDLVAMLERAKREKLWFFCSYQELWFSPAELENAWAEGRFRWGAVNWKLRQPAKHLAELAEDVQQAERQQQEFAQKLARSTE